MQIGLFELFCIKTFQTEIFNRFEKSNDAPNDRVDRPAQEKPEK